MDIGAIEQELLIEEAHTLAGAVQDPRVRGRYERLEAALGTGSVNGAELTTLENLLELGLQTGRLRKRYTAEGEQALLRLFQKTPRGIAVAAATGEVNHALAALQGQTLTGVAFTSRAPGVYGLTLDTDQGHFSLRIHPEGITLDTVELDF
ncbi:MAG: hypothetical protein U0822_15175 [Anaerolineae bacterium]